MNDASRPAGSEGPSTFELGRVLMTRGIQALVEAQRIEPRALLQRHVRGDWGDLEDEDKSENDAGLVDGRRLTSSYRIDAGLTVWIITEARRDVTTLLLPQRVLKP